MRRPGGYLVTTDPDPSKSQGQKAKEECDTFTCGHCNRIVKVKPMCDPADAGGMCQVCATLICPRCVAMGKCDPLEEKLRRMEDRDRFRRELS